MEAHPSGRSGDGVLCCQAALDRSLRNTRAPGRCPRRPKAVSPSAATILLNWHDVHRVLGADRLADEGLRLQDPNLVPRGEPGQHECADEVAQTIAVHVLDRAEGLPTG